MFKRYIGPAAIAAAVVILGLVANADAARRFPWPAEIIAGNDGTDQQVVYVDSSGTVATGGNVASGATDSGNPLKMGAVFNTTFPTVTTGQRVDLQTSNRGALYMALSDGGTNIANLGANTTDAKSAASVGPWVLSQGQLWNGATLDRQQAVQNSTNSVGTGITAAGLVGQCDDTTPTALTENSFGNAKIDCATHGIEVAGTCNQQVAIAVTAANTTQLIALSGTTVIRVCYIKVNISATGTYTLLSGTGSNCGTPLNSTGAMTLALNTADNWGDGVGTVWQGSAGGELCMTAVTGNLTGIIRYSQY